MAAATPTARHRSSIPSHGVGFNLIVQWNDGFFMPLMFLLAGLFVRPSLERKGLGRYLADRALRLGVPLLIGVATVVPLSYYATYLQAGGSGGFGAFWAHMVTEGPVAERAVVVPGRVAGVRSRDRPGPAARERAPDDCARGTG